MEFGTVSRRQARRYLAARRAGGFRLLHDLGGAFYAVGATSWYRLRATAAPVPTEAHVLHAALRAYGVTDSFTNSGGGVHYVVVPLGPVPAEPLDSCHITIAAGEHTQRHPQDHEEAFTAWLCDDAGNPVGGPLYLGVSTDCAMDAALCAKAVAGWLARH
ncbi:hypothetical protein GCM10025734_01620 [Kitasatospora paranensis]|uniref:hypothetical protein n=1 Tax=Kitasatospora paranensis TaxID=258053 RepID=UPI0031E931AA